MSENPMREAIQSAINENPVILFMKGNPDQPAWTAARAVERPTACVSAS